ncbi:hypothetical protein [Jannaschia aquimarina]|uniref:Peptidase C51 domain-containing protein n=1 Tax=Jannaschia aquimarina TaxID=935700 RepID=A0A0D1EGX5_9RHOB|nr:hypothetical protein [Jannaschia aquimarina]KIT16879.1 hypothetical protein jaqu_13770 [Jannaschia aquimarina]SNT12486.1 TIGR02594 family protein [Jannaschia aquimarina]
MSTFTSQIEEGCRSFWSALARLPQVPLPAGIAPGGTAGASPLDAAAEGADTAGSDRAPDCTTGNCCDDPVWLQTAEAELGTLEILGGSGSNPRVEEYHASTGNSFTDDTAWCSSFVNWVMENTTNPRTGEAFPSTNSAGSQSWMNWGTATEPFVGALIVIKWSPDSWEGHNTILVGETTDGNGWWGLGGNQGIANDGSRAGLAVNVSRYAKGSTIRSIRKPSGFTPCPEYLEIPKMTAAEVEAKYGAESGSANGYDGTR